MHSLREAGAEIREFELAPPDLEEVFLRVMRGGEAAGAERGALA